MSRSQSLATLSPKSLRDRWSGTRSFFLAKTTQPLRPSEASIGALERQTLVTTEEMAADSSSGEESDFARELRHQLKLRLAAPVLNEEGSADCLEDVAPKRESKSHRDKAASDISVPSDTLPLDISELQDELEHVQEERKQVEAAWKRENMRLREQLASTSQREATQRQQLRTCEDNLAMCQQELQELRHQLHQKHEQPREIVDSDLSAEVAARERAMLEFMLELVGRDRIRTLLNELPDASPGQLRQEILQLARTQHLSAAPMSPRSLALTQRIGIPKKQSSAPAPLLPSRSPSTLDVVYEKIRKANGVR